jgi:hypothetical protein
LFHIDVLGAWSEDNPFGESMVHQEKLLFPISTSGITGTLTGVLGLSWHQSSWEALRTKSLTKFNPEPPCEALGHPGGTKELCKNGQCIVEFLICLQLSEILAQNQYI